MKKSIVCILCCFILFSSQESFAWENKEKGFFEDPIIISREEWGANERYNLYDSIYWKQILERWKNAPKTQKSQEQINKEKEKQNKINTYLNENFYDQFDIEYKNILNPQGAKYAWPLEYVDYMDGIIIHHTHSEYTSSIEWMKQIQKYHSINRQWGDIGYNYIIGYNGEIFEWREWWDYVAAAHSKYNNRSNIWIAVLWNYTSKWLKPAQYKSLDTLIKFVSKKYWIDLSKKKYYHMDCSWKKCEDFYLETYKDSTLIWHRDSWHTSCPGEVLYKQIQTLREENLDFTRWFTPISRKERKTIIEKQQEISRTTAQKRKLADIHKYRRFFTKYNKQEKELILEKVELRLELEQDQERRKNLKIIRFTLLLETKY